MASEGVAGTFLELLDAIKSEADEDVLDALASDLMRGVLQLDLLGAVRWQRHPGVLHNCWNLLPPPGREHINLLAAFRQERQLGLRIAFATPR